MYTFCLQDGLLSHTLRVTGMQAQVRAGRAGRTTAGTSDRRGQPAKKKQYGMSEEAKQAIAADNAAMDAAKKRREKELARQNRAALVRMHIANKKAGKQLEAIAPSPFMK